jgi:hypothetical protein
MLGVFIDTAGVLATAEHTVNTHMQSNTILKRNLRASFAELKDRRASLILSCLKRVEAMSGGYSTARKLEYAAYSVLVGIYAVHILVYTGTDVWSDPNPNPIPTLVRLFGLTLTLTALVRMSHPNPNPTGTDVWSDPNRV